MASPNRALRVLRCIAVAVVKAGSAAALRPAVGTVTADGLVEAVPGIAREFWHALRRSPDAGGVAPAELQAAIAELAALQPDAAAVVAVDALEAEGAQLTSDAQATAITYQVLHGLELVRLVGRGGYGEVWEAVPRGVPGVEPVALKFCTDDRARRQLLEHEAGVAARVMRVGRHPGIVRLSRMHLDDEVPSLEFEFVAGGDLRAMMRSNWARDAPWEVADTFELMRRVVEPFAFMHAASPAIVHRDAKLSNILVDRDGCLRVTDFGIGGLAFISEDVALSRRGVVSLAPHYTQVARGAYTPHYASRGQMAGADAHPADDVYSLGVILYQLLTRRIDEGAPSGDWQDELADEGLPAIAIEVLEKALARTRERRFASAVALLAAVERVCQAMNPGASRMVLSGAITKPSASEPELVVPARPALEVPGLAVPKQVPPNLAATVARSVIVPSAAPIMTGIGLKMMYVAPQEFLMGSPAGEKGRLSNELQHRVRIAKGYWLGETAVTQWMWREVMDSAPKWGGGGTIVGDTVAATCVTWDDAVAFCVRLTERELAARRLPPGHHYTLPTEAEWELACRAATTTAYCFGNDTTGLGSYAIYKDARDGDFAHAVKSRKPNAWGFFDMHGNVLEWCRNGAHWVDTAWVTDTYRDGIQDPFCVDGLNPVLRGGNWGRSAADCRSAVRSAIGRGSCLPNLGFRPVLSAGSDVR